MAKVYLITASTGIGAETARQIASQGDAAFFIVSRTAERCSTLVADLRNLGAEAEFFAGDLGDPGVAPEAVQNCTDRFGRIDALFNVAGISGRKFGDGPIHQCTEEGWNHVLNTNLTSQYRMCRETVRQMLRTERGEKGLRGTILNMASILGVHPEPMHFGAVAYAASKGAIIAMSRTMAATYAPEGIRVNVIAPALVHTPMSARASEDEEILDFITKKQPLTQGVIPVEDAAAASAFLLGKGSHSITGHVLTVDAGWSLV